MVPAVSESTTVTAPTYTSLLAAAVPIFSELAEIVPVIQISQLRDLKAEAQRGYEQYVADAKAHIVKIDEETEAEVARIKAEVSAAKAELQSAEREVVVAKAKANAEAKQQKAELEAEIAELEAKKKSIEDALESLKAKIG